ncbi:MAG: Response regulator receiver protein [Limisphaerales bacterium]|nr:MAG: Response regulator receiver protein [Limisphaerales bacterium]KAG0508811.1 MAG: Response regulator receiver protein [Limisphaerales bacterium]
MKKLLIIEDDRIIGSIYSKKFAVEGFNVEVAEDGQTGLERITGFRPDIVLLDLMLPKLNGLDILARVRAMPEFQRLPIIVFSNAYMSTVIDAAWKAGATTVLTKSNTSPKKLTETIHELLAQVEAAPPPPAAPPAKAPVAAPAPAPAAQDDDAFQAEQRRQFLTSIPQFNQGIRDLHQNFLKTEDRTAKIAAVGELYRHIHALTGSAGMVGADIIARISAAYEALLKEMHDKPGNINVSTTRTSTQTLFFISALLEKAAQLPHLTSFDPIVLAVDDEEISRRAVTFSIEKAGVRAVICENGAAALEKARSTHFDLIVLDVDMPGMNGYEVCTKLRAQPAYKDTPVIFVTGLSDFQSRARSTLSGANDLIAKPFVFVELSVKVLSYLLKATLATQRVL